MRSAELLEVNGKMGEWDGYEIEHEVHEVH